MRKPAGFILAFTAILLSSTSPAAGTRLYMDSIRTGMLREGQELLFNDRFSAVDSLYDSYIEAYPDDPAGYLFKAAALIGEMADQEQNLYPELSGQLLDSVEVLVTRSLDTCSNEVRAWMYLMLGHAKAYRSLWESRFGSAFAAIKLGFAARSAYTRGLEADSSLYDLYFGLGCYHYWKSARAGLLRWFRNLKNEKDKGIAELYLAADSSLLSREVSRSALIWIWLEEKEYDSAIVISREFLEYYPDGKSFLWPLATACYKLKNYESALEAYRRLRARIAQAPGNFYNLIECDHNISRCLEKLDRRKEARRHAQKIMTYYDVIPKSTLNRQRTKTVYLLRLAEK